MTTDLTTTGEVSRDNAVTTLLKGAIAGVAATWLMGKATEFMYEHEDQLARDQEDKARGDQTAYEVAADKAAGAIGISLSKEERKKSAGAIHWALGATAGMTYATIKSVHARLSTLAGIGFGTVFWAVMDETLTPALGLSPGPKAFPLETHARGLAGHAVLGAALDASLAVVDRII